MLYISFLFPPSCNVSGITLSKRIIENQKVVDVLQAKNKSDDCKLLNKYVDEYINNRIIVDIACDNDWAVCISEFVQKAIKLIKDDYKKIYSRSWLMSNHFLAFEYKLSNQDVFWSAEFSDPLIYDISNNPKKYREMIITDEKYIKKINNQIKKYNEYNDSNFDLIKKNTSAYFIAEYVTYLFADEVIFTNENQRKVMLNQFPVDIEEHIINKTKIRPHPTLPPKFYSISDVDLNLNPDFINIAYFGGDYYSRRHFESLFYAFDSLNHKYKEKIKFYFYISDVEVIKSLIKSLQSPHSFKVLKPLNYIDFLNATTQFDVLVVNDLITCENFKINPYLPSKLSDYLGSKTDIWALYERGSVLSTYDLKYKSDISNLDECLHQLVKILENNGYVDEDYSIQEDYLFKRLTSLNELYEREFRQKMKYKKQFDEIISSKSWRITRPFRNLKNNK